MKKVLHIFLLIAVLSCSAMSQADFDEPKWTKFENKYEEFTVNFPTPRINGATKNSESGPGQYIAIFNKTYFAVFSDKKPENSPLELIKNLGSTADIPGRDVEIDSLTGKRYDFHGTDDFEHSFITVQAPVYFYIFHVISETRDNPMIEEFLGSIHFDKTVVPGEAKTVDTKTVEPKESPASASTPEPDFANIFKQGPAGGMASAMGNTNSAQNVVAPPKTAKIDSAATITFKANPPYTDLGRRYLISGTVRLRVTFEKNGEIGEIRTLSKLPLGLTQSAIRAARQIRFSPAVRQGEPYTTTKPVDFNFTIY